MSQSESRYIQAINSSRLEATEFAGAIDSFIAAGWVSESLIGLLWRARNEFDCLNRKEGNCHETNMLFAMMQMKTLPEARKALGAFCVGQWALKTDTGITRDRALELSSRCLQAFISPKCTICRGIGFSGGYRTQRIHCLACKEKGVILGVFGKVKEDIDFASMIMARLDEKTESLARSVFYLTKAGGKVERARKMVCEAVHDL